MHKMIIILKFNAIRLGVLISHVIKHVTPGPIPGTEEHKFEAYRHADMLCMVNFKVLICSAHETWDPQVTPDTDINQSPKPNKKKLTRVQAHKLGGKKKNKNVRSIARRRTKIERHCKFAKREGERDYIVCCRV